MHTTRPSCLAATSRSFASAAQHFAATHCTRQQQPGKQMAATTKQTELDWDAYDHRWIEIWEGGLQKGQAFDKGACSPQLLQLIKQSGTLQVSGKRVFVPGCGRGYDVFAFAAAGAALAVGLDLCPIAIAAASVEQAQELANSPPSASAACELVSGNFFSYSHSSGQPFDIGYDYTFLCALHPDMRRKWAKTWARILAPGGELVTMVYPVDSSMDPDHGPPWPVTPELYKELLLPEGFELVSLEPIPSVLSHPSRTGREWLGRWRDKSSSSGSNSASR